MVPSRDIVAASVEVLRREESLKAQRGGFKGEFEFRITLSLAWVGSASAALR